MIDNYIAQKSVDIVAPLAIETPLSQVLLLPSHSWQFPSGPIEKDHGWRPGLPL